MKNVVIIGAGPAGLSCAYKLLKENNDLKVTIIEEESQVGGISKTIKYKGNRMDLGGHRFFTKNDEVLNFWLDILPLQGKPSLDDKILKLKKNFSKKGPNPEKDDKVMLIRNRVSRIYYNKKFFDYPVNLNFKTVKNMGFITTTKCGFSYIKASFFKLDEYNLENFYINRFGYKLYSMFFKEYTTKLWGREPKEIDSSWGSQRVKGISIRAVLSDYFKRLFKINNKNKEISLIEYFYYPKLGPGQLYEEVSKKIKEMGGEILLKSKVIKINNKTNCIKEIIYETSGSNKTIKCDYLVSSMPMKDLVNQMNNIPNKISNISNNLPYRDFLTIGVLVKELSIKNNNNTIHKGVEDNWIYVQDKFVKMGRIQIFNNWSPYMVKEPIKTVWMGLEYFCCENDDFWNKSDKELIKFGQNELYKMGLIEEDVIEGNVVRVKKAYPAYFDTYSEIDKLRKYLNKYSNLYCIGRNGTHSYNNMDHSILSGFICADMIKENSHDLDKLWNVNVSSDYQEEK